MKFIQIYFLLTAITGIFFLFPSAFNNSNGSRVKEFESKKGEVLPMEQWDSILLGKWEFYFEKSDMNNICIAEGEIEYKPEDKLIKTIHINIYGKHYLRHGNDKPCIKEDCLELKIGGTLEGEYYLWKNDSTITSWSEHPQKCGLNPAFVYHNSSFKQEDDFCDIHEKKLYSYIYRPFQNGGVHSSLYEPIIFSENEILLREKDFANNNYNYYYYKRVQE